MDSHQHHEELVEGAVGQLAEIFGKSGQGVYIYLDDRHIACNARFAKMLGYSSSKAWAAAKGSFPLIFVAEGSRSALIHAYRNAMEKKIGS